jgi:CDP-glucose 4,6-dehydratase
MINSSFWKNRKVLITGATGVKGSWLLLWLNQLGAKIYGYSLPPPTLPNLFSLINGEDKLESIKYSDIRSNSELSAALLDWQPEIVFHLAAQPIVRMAYTNPPDTFSTNIMGTVNILNSSINLPSIKVICLVTSDKCYFPKKTKDGYIETDPLGGLDPYSGSKACAEIIGDSYERVMQLYRPNDAPSIISLRAGNIIGGGDFGTDRLVPDCIRAFLDDKPLLVRNPEASRTWVYVLDVIRGYILSAQQAYNDISNKRLAINFASDEISKVAKLVEHFKTKLGIDLTYDPKKINSPVEAEELRLNSSKAHELLKWKAVANLDYMLDSAVQFIKIYKNNKSLLEEHCLKELEIYQQLVNGH